MPVKRHPDYIIIGCAGALVLFGLVMIFSSSAVLAGERFNDTYYFLKRQAIWSVIGVVVMIVTMRIDYRILSRYSALIYWVTVAFLILVFSNSLGREINGAQRWISLGFVSFQPSEFAKLGLIIFFASLLAKKEHEGKLTDFKLGFLPLIGSLALVFSLIQVQPDLGTAVIIGLVSMIMFLVAGVRFTHLLCTVLIAMPILVTAVYNVGYRRKRILSFLDPWEDAANSGYQIIQSFVALSRGGYFGEGLGAGHQKLFFLPEPHTDFIFSIVAEELGLAGGTLILFLFAMLTIRGVRAGLKAPDRFGSLLALGITFCIALQAAVNISVTMGVVPTKGLPLPFISLGGSALVMWMASVGLLANVSEHSA